MTLLLDAVGPAEVFLVAVAFFNGIWNTAVGSTGGMMFASLAAVFPPAIAVSIQSLSEGPSAAYRTWQLREQVNLQFLFLFIAGGTIGAAAGYPLISLGTAERSKDALQLVVGVMILAMAWLPIARQATRTRFGAPGIGMATTFICLFVGGMGGPISAALEGRGESHPVVIATSSASVYIQYVLRIMLFGLTGVTLRAHIWLILALLAASLAGTWLGARVLLSIDPEKARRVFRAAVTALAVSLIVRAGLR